MDHLVPDDGLAVIAALAAHPFAEVDRMMNDDERERLKASINASGSGILQPIVLFEGRILDGQAIYRSADQPMPRRMRAAIAALPFEHPKLSVTANVGPNIGFARGLERAGHSKRKGSG